MLSFLSQKIKGKSGATVLFDIGGTKMRVAVSFDGVHIVGEKHLPTPPDFKTGIASFVRLAHQATNGAPILRAVGGAAGVLTRDKDAFFHSPHLPQWNGKPLKKRLSQLLEAPVHLENDSAVVGLGEAHVGAGHGYDIVAYITVSTGVGGARIVCGKIDEASFGFEPGHQIINFEDQAHKSHGELENYVSGTSITERFNIDPKDLSNKRALSQLAKTLSFGIHNTIVHWSPDVVVFGGSVMTGRNVIPLDEVETHLKKSLYFLPKLPKLKKGALGSRGGLEGALVLAGQP